MSTVAGEPVGVGRRSLVPARMDRTPPFRGSTQGGAASAAAV
jgi:hypothetical protein